MASFASVLIVIDVINQLRIQQFSAHSCASVCVRTRERKRYLHTLRPVDWASKRSVCCCHHFFYFRSVKTLQITNAKKHSRRDSNRIRWIMCDGIPKTKSSLGTFGRYIDWSLVILYNITKRSWSFWCVDGFAGAYSCDASSALLIAFQGNAALCAPFHAIDQDFKEMIKKINRK